MSRRFPDFLKAYQAYTDDGFIPPQFNTWTALSIIAGALERKVWLPWSDSYSFYPNIYALLISPPGDGKSMAINTGIKLLQAVNKKTGLLNIMPNQVTEAKFIELMGTGRSFSENKSEKEIIHGQNAGYYFASEASNELKNVFGDFIACLTSFYDCPDTWERATKKDGKKIQLKNVCMNLIAGSTFDYLGKLVNDENIRGGFASRLIYIVSKNKEVYDQQFQQGISESVTAAEREVYKDALIDDLTSISKMVGPMKASQEFGKAWEKWYPEFERNRRKLQSEKLQSLIARANTNVLKVSMLLSAAESDDRELKLKHWTQAVELVLPLYESLPSLFREARSNNTDPTKINVAATIISLIEKDDSLNKEQIINKLSLKGPPRYIVDQTIKALVSEEVIGIDQGSFKIISNADNHF